MEHNHDPIFYIYLKKKVISRSFYNRALPKSNLKPGSTPWLEEGKHSFNVMCLTETWLKDHAFKTNWKYHFQNYEGSHYERKTKKSLRKVLIYIINDSTYKIRKDLCISDGDRGIVTTKLITKRMTNIIVVCCYKQSDGNWNNHWNHLQEILKNATTENKLYFVTGDLNLSCLEFYWSFEIRQFFSFSIWKRSYSFN